MTGASLYANLNENIFHLVAQMSKALFLLLTAVFLAAQMFSLAHATGYAIGEHEHRAVDCEICIRAKLQNLAPADPSDETCLISYELSAKQLSASLMTPHDPCRTVIIRGPPFFS